MHCVLVFNSLINEYLKHIMFITVIGNYPLCLCIEVVLSKISEYSTILIDSSNTIVKVLKIFIFLPISIASL